MRVGITGDDFMNAAMNTTFHKIAGTLSCSRRTSFTGL
jgi:hypothetical protein